MTCAVAGATFALTAGDVAVSDARDVHASRRRAAEVWRAVGRRSRDARGAGRVRRAAGVRAAARRASSAAWDRSAGGRLKAGDVLPIGAGHDARRRPTSGRQRVVPLPLPAGGARLRVVAGPQEHVVHASRRTRRCSDRDTSLRRRRIAWATGSTGPPLAHAGRADILSDATPLGSIQVPASGQPILLMADRQTTGGYPKIGVVISADLPLAGQLAPGDWIEFAPCTREAAVDALRLRHRSLLGGAR